MGWCSTIVVMFHASDYEPLAKLAAWHVKQRNGVDAWPGQVFLEWLGMKGYGDVAVDQGHGHEGVVTWSGCFDKVGAKPFIESLRSFWLDLLVEEEKPARVLHGLHYGGRVLVVEEREQFSATTFYTIDSVSGELVVKEFSPQPMEAAKAEVEGAKNYKHGERSLFDFDGERRW